MPKCDFNKVALQLVVPLSANPANWSNTLKQFVAKNALTCAVFLSCFKNQMFTEVRLF